jgi:hypothetical protein
MRYEILLVFENGDKATFDTSRSVSSLISEIIRNDIETIAVFKLADDGVVEKQFISATVMPIGFGAK